MKILILAFLVLQGGCASLLKTVGSDYHQGRSISILTVNLFNQRLMAEGADNNWKGDWLFRRERLEIVDLSIMSMRPDLILFQELLGRRGSPSESDRSILSYGSLDGYQWGLSRTDFFEDTQEEEYLGLAIGSPLSLDEEVDSYWGKLGSDGRYSLRGILIEGQPFWVVNVSMPSNSEETNKAYEVLRKNILELQGKLSFCNERLIVAGYLPSDVTLPNYQKLLETFQLKDTSLGFCEIYSQCYTATTENEVFRNTSQGKSEAQVDRILAHNETIVYAGKIALDDEKASTERARFYGLSNHWPTRRYGWSTILRLTQCRK